MARPKILVIEDEAGIRRLIKKTLESDYEIHLAADGQEGLTQVQAVKPDLILLDIQMPGLDGLSVLRKLRADEATKSIPVVIVSVHGETQMMAESQRAGAVDHLIKPFHIDDLRKVVHRQSLPGD